MNTYQAIYEGVRSRIYNGDIGSIAERVLYDCFDISHARQMLQAEISTIGYEHIRPSVLFRPRIYMDGNKWCAMYGDNLQDGVSGFGDSPALAFEDFDKNWNKKLEGD